ncbi:hypothetical protein [Leptospira vanthielii]|uniref:Uncharacterized protein n=1 Tax=Leptospira vanthielii TaxID=293085 RepID=A0ABY2NU44_9LEPT|nr:hypothetical protein [Leptospira vanthielii]TGM61797.1 hypothetical protein EHQ95_00065 [Leptospira vanthielii]
MNSWIQKAKTNLLKFSEEKINLNLARMEWNFQGEVIDNYEDLSYDEEKPSCDLCEHENLRWQFSIKNIKNRNELLVGSTCIKQFDINYIDVEGKSVGGKERDLQLESLVRKSISNSKHENVLQALRKLWKSEILKNRGIIEIGAKQWKEKKSISPKMMLFLIWRFKEKKISYLTLKFNISIRTNEQKLQVLNFKKWQYLEIEPFLNNNQKKKYTNYLNKGKL